MQDFFAQNASGKHELVRDYWHILDHQFRSHGEEELADFWHGATRDRYIAIKELLDDPDLVEKLNVDFLFGYLRALDDHYRQQFPVVMQ